MIPSDSSHSVRSEIAWFVGLTFALSSVFYVLIARAGGLSSGSSLLVAGLMWTPGLVAVALQLRSRGSLRGLGWGLGRGRYWLLAYMLPIGYALVIYLAIWISPWGEFDSSVPGRLQARWYLLVFGSVLSCLSALGEEIGWRGFLVPRLAGLFDFDRVALISGLIWAVWHYPLILFSDYRSPAPVWYSVFCFTVMAVGISYLFAWITLASGSVWPAVLLHGSHNLWVQGVFDRATIDNGPTEYLSGEFGAGLALAGVVVALVTRRLARGGLPTERSADDPDPRGSGATGP